MIPKLRKILLLLLAVFVLAVCGCKSTPTPSPTPLDPESAQSADAAMAEGRYALAANMYENQLNNGTITVDLLNRLGFCRLQLGEYREAVEALSRSLEIEPDGVDAYYNRGLAFYGLEQWDRAIYDFRNAVNRSTGDKAAQALNNVAMAFQKKGEPELAVETYNEALRAAPGDSRTLFNRGTLFFKLRLFDTAVEDLNAVLQNDPDNVDALNNRGVVHLAMGEPGRADADFTRAILQAPNRADIYYNRGLAKYDQGLYRQAVTDFTRAIGRKPDYVEAYNNRGAAYIAMQQEAQGCKDLKHACEFGLCTLHDRMVDRQVCQDN